MTHKIIEIKAVHRCKLEDFTNNWDQGWVIRFKYVFVYQHSVYLYWKSQKGAYLIIGLYLKKYLQIHIKITILPTKGKALLDTNWLSSTEKIGNVLQRILLCKHPGQRFPGFFECRGRAAH